MSFLPIARNRRNLLLAAAGLFVISRALTLMAFPIFNDEAIYIQYAQSIHENWQQNRFVSMAGEMYHDWKPPLQYWIAAPFIEWGNDPLVPARLIALTASAAGLFGFYAFAKRLFGEAEGLLSAFLYVLCPTVIFHNNQYIAETFLFSVAPIFYWTLLKAIGGARPALGWAVTSVLLGTALLLFKQSSYLLLAISAFLPFVKMRTEEKRSKPFSDRVKWRSLGINFALVLGVIAVSGLAADAVLPQQFDEVRERFDSKWVMSPSEILGAPLQIWGTNLRLIVDYTGAYYSWAFVPFLGLFFWRAVRTRNSADLVLGCMFLTAAGCIVLLLRGFNEYMFNTAVIALLLPLGARAMVAAWQQQRGAAAGFARFAFLACAAFTIAHWTYQDGLMGMSPGKYVERSTPWAKANYLEQWPTGFGVKEIVGILEKEKRPGIIFADLQWGNPRTALEIYARKHFPNLRIVPIMADFNDETSAQKVRDLAVNLVPARFAIYSADASRRRQHWMRNFDKICVEREEIRAYPSQMPIVLCRF
jgi:4-amino-4-deoxy-L-arabinose transferase-like glycosyltransferase